MRPVVIASSTVASSSGVRAVRLSAVMVSMDASSAFAPSAPSERPLSRCAAKYAVPNPRACRNDRLGTESVVRHTEIGGRTDATASFHGEPMSGPQCEGGTMDKILIATDGSTSAAEAVAFGLDLAEKKGASVFLVHVAPELDWAPVL